MQVFIACAHATKLVGRVTDTEPPTPDNTLVSYEDMCARLSMTLEPLAGVDEGVAEERAGDLIDFPTAPDRMLKLSVAAVIEDYHLPNIFFHVMTAYNILRKEGIAGKGRF